MPFIGLGAWLLLDRQEKYKAVWRGAIAVPLGFAIAYIAGELFYNPRPFVAEGVEAFFHHEADNGFPSSHTLAAALIAGVVYFSSRKIGLVLVACAAAVGICRVLAHVHSWIDVITSAAIVVFAVIVANFVIARLSYKLLTFGLEQQRPE